MGIHKHVPATTSVAPISIPNSVTSFLRRSIAVAILLTPAATVSARSQTLPSEGGQPSTSRYETRQQLEAQAAAAEKAHRTSEAWLLRQRLQNGDFQESDRIVVVMQNTPTPADTYTVRAGRVLILPRFGEVSLAGVLRSEVADRISTYVSRFLRDSTVRATPLVRIGVLGRVGRPGYYNAGADVILSDVLMMAGGPAPDADLRKVVIRRGSDVIWNEENTRTALADGLTLDRLHLRAGDEIEVGVQKQFSWMSILSVVSGVVVLLGALLRFK
jgi:hypothetical protein